MSDFYPDPCQALASRSAQNVMGWNASGPVLKTMFLQRMAAWDSLLQNIAGDNLALYMDDSLEFAAALFAAWQLKKTVWLTADTLPATCQVLHKTVDAFLGNFPDAYQPLQAAAQSSRLAIPGKLDPQFIGLVVHTSGSTGVAQAIPKKLSQLFSEVASLEQVFGARVGHASIAATVSHQHIYGLLFKVLWPLMAGRPVHALSLNFPEQFTQVLAQGESVLIASPAHLKRLPEHLDWQSVRKNVRAVFSSGGPLAPETAFAVGELLGKIPLEVYGSSETGGIAWRQRQHGAVDAWDALPNVILRIAQDQGLLEVRSPHLQNTEWLRLADKAQMTEHGRLLLLGRSDRIVKIEEKRISLDAMEMALLASDLVSEVRVIADHADTGQRQKLTAFVVTSEKGAAIFSDEGKYAFNQRLRAILAGVVEAIALPRRWRFLEQIPVNAQGKTSHVQLLALLNEEADPRPRLPRLRLLEQTPLRVMFELIVPASLFYFDGHFNVAPVLPGVVQVDWVIRFARQYLDLPPVFLGIHALKFQHVIHAESPVMLELIHDVAKSSLQFRYFSDAGQHAGGRILFANEKTTC
ncbi:AMP-binding protein [Undibacterium sp. TJN19]|uniref:AMP-binding protein n=1 Tax=Undibacterium sp. TJN19 TaxID=3413055 RepID=UPI003BF0DADE